MRLKRDKRDAVFSELVRERVNWICENCGKYYPEGAARRGLHCSHYVGRSHRSTRWDPANAFSHCYGCHSHFEQNPGLFQRWYVERMGETTEQAIVEKGRQITHWKKHDLEDIHKHLVGELKRMKSLRKDGVDGRIEFIGWF
jgi:hypothetical protein